MSSLGFFSNKQSNLSDYVAQTQQKVEKLVIAVANMQRVKSSDNLLKAKDVLNIGAQSFDNVVNNNLENSQISNSK